MPKWINDPVVQKIFRLTDVSERIDWALTESKIPDVWTETMGEGIVVGVIDADLIDHPDINPNIYLQKTFTSDEKPVNGNGHGLFTAGIIGAAKNSVGIIGCAPKVRLHIYKALSNEGDGSENDIANAISAAIDDRVDIINMSLGSSYDFRKIYVQVKMAYDKGIPCVCAAGNDGHFEIGSTVNYPAKYKEAIAVASINKEGNVSDYSSAGDEVDVSAGGEDVYSCFAKDGKPIYAVLSGTSFSAPIVTGVIALCLAKHRKSGGNTPVDTVEQIRQHIIRTADDAGQIGKDKYYGYGIINAEKAVFEKNNISPPPIVQDNIFVTMWKAILGLFGIK